MPNKRFTTKIAIKINGKKDKRKKVIHNTKKTETAKIKEGL